MIKEQRKYCYGVYTLMFLLMCIVAFLPFFTEGISFGWGARVENFSVIFWRDTQNL